VQKRKDLEKDEDGKWIGLKPPQGVAAEMV